LLPDIIIPIVTPLTKEGSNASKGKESREEGCCKSKEGSEEVIVTGTMGSTPG
jgi:hypothetical protein